MTKDILEEKLKKYEKYYSFSILDEQLYDAYNLSDTTGNGFAIYYLDERGNRHEEVRFRTFNDACQYLLELMRVRQL